MKHKVKLLHTEGNSPVHIYAEIRDNGDLILSGQDASQHLSESWGHVDFEYWLTIRAEYKDQVLLALIEKLYSGNPVLISEMKDFLESKRVPCEFYAYA